MLAFPSHGKVAEEGKKQSPNSINLSPRSSPNESANSKWQFSRWIRVLQVKFFQFLSSPSSFNFHPSHEYSILAKLYLIKMLVKRFKLKVKIELMKDEGVVYLCFS